MENFTEINKEPLDCENGVPTFTQFFKSFDTAKWCILGSVIVLSTSLLCIYSVTLKNLINNAPKSIRLNCISLISIYPIVSVSSVIAVIVPRVYFFMDTIGHISFMIISYQLYRYC